MKTMMIEGQKFEVTDTMLVQITDDTLGCFIDFAECQKAGLVRIHYRFGDCTTSSFDKDHISPTVNEALYDDWLVDFSPEDLAFLNSKLKPE